MFLAPPEAEAGDYDAWCPTLNRVDWWAMPCAFLVYLCQT
jgi:hypothetical protein